MSGIPAWAVRGAKVVCIQTMVRSDSGPAPELRATYEVRDPHIAFGDAYFGLEGMVDVEADYLAGTLGPFWPATWFRPLISASQEQDVAIFRPILDQVPVGA